MSSVPSNKPRGGSLVDRLPGFLFPRVSGLTAMAILIATLLIGLLIVPVFQVIYVAFVDPNTGGLTLQNFVEVLPHLAVP